MKNDTTHRREVLKVLGGGAAALGAAFAAPSLVARTAHGELLQSEQEYGGFLVEKIAPGHGVYEYDPEVLQPMSEKQTVFSRNVWDPARENRPEYDRGSRARSIGRRERTSSQPDAARLRAPSGILGDRRYGWRRKAVRLDDSVRRGQESGEAWSRTLGSGRSKHDLGRRPQRGQTCGLVLRCFTGGCRRVEPAVAVLRPFLSDRRGSGECHPGSPRRGEIRADRRGLGTYRNR